MPDTPKKPFYITTTLPYVNGAPHIGFAQEIIEADAMARYQRLQGRSVIFNTGTDEHGQKVYEKAQSEGKTPQDYVDGYAVGFKDLKDTLNLSWTKFIRTTDPTHKAAAQEFWKRCDANGDIYKKNYEVKYCVGCELEKTDSELENGVCPIHPTTEIQLINEENYFFKFSNYQDKLLELYDRTEPFVLPTKRLNEIREFVRGGLQDFSISRHADKMPWGVPVPGDPEQVMYVWFDALVNYISTLGWPDTSANSEFTTHWPGVQIAGKDNLRQQSAMWQAMLLSAGLAPSNQIFIHGFFTVEGQKMSKSLGNVIAPSDLTDKYGTDATRYYFLGGITSDEDSDFSTHEFERIYTTHLKNGIGNLTLRVLGMIAKYEDNHIPAPAAEDPFDTANFWEQYDGAFAIWEFHKAVAATNKLVSTLDEYISREEPWVKHKAGESVSEIMGNLAEGVRQLALALAPIIPETAQSILKQYGTSPAETQSREWGSTLTGNTPEKAPALFPDLNA